MRHSQPRMHQRHILPCNHTITQTHTYTRQTKSVRMYNKCRAQCPSGEVRPSNGKHTTYTHTNTQNVTSRPCVPNRPEPKCMHRITQRAQQDSLSTANTLSTFFLPFCTKNIRCYTIHVITTTHHSSCPTKRRSTTHYKVIYIQKNASSPLHTNMSGSNDASTLMGSCSVDAAAHAIQRFSDTRSQLFIRQRPKRRAHAPTPNRSIVGAITRAASEGNTTHV